jgi:hypothetical protein
MRCTKFALLTFGAGVLLGLTVVVAEIDVLARIASLLMVLGIVALPIGAMIDWLRKVKSWRPAPGRRKPAKPRAAAVARRGRRPRKRAPTKR